MNDAWRSNLLESWEEIQALLRSSKRVAVLGIKTEKQDGQPAFYVPEALQRLGYEIVPVPVYYPEITTILGQKVYRKVADVPGPVDIVDVFRRPQDIPQHVEDILAKKPRCVWMQSGIYHPEAAEVFAKAGIQVVQSRCLMVDAQRAR